MTGSRHSYELPFYIELDLHNMFSYCIANTCPKIELLRCYISIYSPFCLRNIHIAFIAVLG